MNSINGFRFNIKRPKTNAPINIPAVSPDITEFSFLSLYLQMLAPVAKIDISNAQMNCKGYVKENTLEIFSSINIPKMNQDMIGTKEKIALLKLIRSNLFMYFHLYYLYHILRLFDS